MGRFVRPSGASGKKSARADAYDAICDYALYGIEPDLDSMDDAAAIAFDLIKPNLDASNKKAKGACQATAVREAARSSTDGAQIGNRSATDKGRKKEKELEIEKENENEIENEIENECYRAGEQSDFDQFWSQYPKKVGKQAAFIAFNKVSEPVEKLVTAVKRQSLSTQWTKNGGQYIPNAATWLNEGRWEDELAQPSGNAVKASCTMGEEERENIRRLLAEKERIATSSEHKT